MSLYSHHFTKKNIVLFSVFFYWSSSFLPFAFSEEQTVSSISENSDDPILTTNVSPEPEEETFKPVSWEFTGVSRFSPHELNELVRDFIGKPITFSGLSNVTATIEKHYELHGHIARAVIPPQDITSGMVKIEVVEGRFGQIIFDPTGSTSVRKSIVLSLLQSEINPGQLYKSEDFDRRLLVADDLPGVSLTGFLQSSKEPGHVDLVVKSSKEPAYIADLAADNANSRSLGSEKVSFSGMLVSPFKFGETFALQTLKSKGSRYGRFSFGFPLGARGWKMNLNVSRMNYSVVAPELKALDISGKVNEEGLNLRYPIIRSRNGNLYSTFSFDHREYSTTVGGVVQKEYSIDNGKVAFSANFFDKFLKGGANSASLSFTHGKAEGFNVSKNYHTLLNYTVTRQQSFTEKLSLYLSFTGQYGLDIASSNAQQITLGSSVSEQEYLDSAENFSLGGLSGVRAYPSGEASGPQGQKIGVELRYLAAKSLIIKPFYDWGMVEERAPTSLGPTEYEISGAGVSTSWSTPLGFSLQTTYARRIGSNPNPDPNTGFDSDGTLEKNRLWIVLARTF